MSRRGFIAVGVLTAWAGGLALLFVREMNPSPAARLADVALRVVPLTTYYMAERDGRHVGFASIAIDTVPRALQVTEYLVTDSANRSRLTEQLVVRLSRGLTLRDYELTHAAGLDTARITGRVADSTLIVTHRSGADTLPVALPSFAGAVGSAVAVLIDDPQVGAATPFGSIDPATGRSGTRSIRVAAESLFVLVDSAVADSSGRWFAVHKDTVRAWHLVATDAPALDAWIDAQGLVVEARRPDGLVLRRTAFELAFENWRLASPAGAVSARADGGIVAGTWLASGATRPAVAIDSLQVRVGRGIPREFASRLGRSWREGNTIAFSRTPDSRLAARYTLPATERWRRVFEKELAQSPFIEHDDPAIMRQAARLAGGETDPAVVARRIVSWVHDSLRAEAGGSSVSAAKAMARRSGDAREFALLTAALARAAGIPAYPVSGLLQHQGRFYLHAWTDIYLGRWIPVDAMLGQVPADAGHIAFVNGNADIGPDLARVLSRLQLTVISAIRVQ